MSDDNKSADEVMEKFKPLEMKPMTNVQQLQQQLAEKDKRIAELEPLAKCAIELRTWFRVNEFWNDENSEDIFPILEKYGLVEEIEYDPNLHGFVDNADTGDPIWHFPPLAGESV